MSSLSNKVFDFKSLGEAYHPDLSSNPSIIPESYFELFQWISRFQGGKRPRVLDIDILSFAGDHGIAKLFPAPKFRTGEFLLESLQKDFFKEFQVLNQNRLELNHYWVDLGVDFQFESSLNYWLNHSNRLINSKVKARTESFALYPAMTDMELSAAFYNGQKLIDRSVYQEKDMIILHSLGEGQVYSIYNLAWALSASDAQFWQKLFPKTLNDSVIKELQKSAKRHPLSHDPFTNLCFYGGLEMIGICGAILRCAEKGIPFLLSDPASILALQYSTKIAPGAEQYGAIIGSFGSHLKEDFLSLPEEIAYSPSGEEWGPLLWKLQQMLRQFNS